MSSPRAGGFERLLAHPRFAASLEGPPPRRRATLWRAPERVIGAAVALCGSVAIGCAALTVLAFVVIGAGVVKAIPTALLLLVIIAVMAFGARLAWRNLFEDPVSESEPELTRAGLRIVRVEERLPPRVLVAFQDGSTGSFALDDDLVGIVGPGLLGVGSLRNGRMLAFERLVPDVPPPRRAIR